MLRLKPNPYLLTSIVQPHSASSQVFLSFRFLSALNCLRRVSAMRTYSRFFFREISAFIYRLSSFNDFFSLFDFTGRTMTSNLVSMDISSEEVNNNNQEKAGCSGAIEPALVFNRKEATTGDTTASTVPAAAIVSLSGPSPTASVYSLNDTFRIKVTSAEEWLCVARMPRDFTQTQLESLLDEFWPYSPMLSHSFINNR